MQWLSNLKKDYGWLTLMRSAAFGIALTSLLIGARNGTPRGTLLLLFGLYIVAATVWVRGQYAESLGSEEGTHTVPKRGTSAMCVVAGLVLVVLGFSHHAGLHWLNTHTGGVALTGIVVGYFGIGGLITAWRARQHAKRGNPLAVEILLGAGLVAVILGAAVLGHVNIVVSVALLGAAVLVLFPVGLQLASAQAIDRLTARSKHWRLGLGFGGLGVFLLATIVASWRAHSTLLIGACVTLGLAIAAIASATQADIAAVFAVVAVLGVTPYQPGLPDTLMPQTFARHDPSDKAHVAQILVALGDSYMSGEGASVYYSGTDEANGDQCRRSPTSWAAMAGQQPPFDGLAFLACSGASTFNVSDSGLDGLPQPRAQGGEPDTQIRQWNDLNDPLRFSPKLVVVTLGGNDAGFGVIGQMCLAPGSCADRGDLWPTSLPQVKHALEHTYDRIAATFPDTPVLVVGYPNPIADTSRCGQLALTGTERRFVRDFVTALDSTIKDAATSRHFYYLDTSLQTLALAHLQLCDPRNEGQPGLNFIGLRSVRGNPEQRFNPQNWIHNSFHPNERGHQAILRAFETWWATHPKLTPRTSAAPIAPDPPAVATAQAPNPPCDITAVVPHNCKQEGQRWALQQVGGMLIPGGLIFGLLVVGGAWAASVGLFGWRRDEGRGHPPTAVALTEPNTSRSPTAEEQDEPPGGVA
jgi:lysophospholipase L1-like esterase